MAKTLSSEEDRSTGTDALRMYERITPAQQQAVSNILTSGEKKEYRDEVQVVSAQPSPVCPQALSLPRPIPDPNAVSLPANYFQQIVLLFQVFSATDVILTFIRDQ